MKRLLKLGAAGLLCAGALVGGSHQVHAEKWSMAAPWGGGPLLEMMAKGFATDVGFLTNGEVEIEVFPGGTLGKALKVTQTVKKGVAEIGHNWAGYDWGIDRTGVLFGGFAGTMNHEKMMHWLYRGGGVKMLADWRMEKFGVVAFPCGSVTREIFMHSHKRVQNLADYKGMKVRTSGAWAEIAQTLGASTVILAGAEVFPALERKVVDGIEWGSPSMNTSAGFAKVAKYIIIPGVHQPTAFQECLVNSKSWNAISERNQKLIEIAGQRITENSYMSISHDDSQAFLDMIASGNEVVRLDQAFIDAAKKATATWAEAQGTDNAWFAKVWENQVAYSNTWDQAAGYRQ